MSWNWFRLYQDLVLTYLAVLASLAVRIGLLNA